MPSRRLYLAWLPEPTANDGAAGRIIRNPTRGMSFGFRASYPDDLVVKRR